MKNGNNGLRQRIASACVAGALGAGAWASPGAAEAETATAGVAGSEETGGLAEIVVTAERRTEDLQKVPISATVLGAKELKEEGVLGIQDLQSQTPGLSIQAAASSETFINIRGVGIQQTSPTSSNGVAFYVDGMYVPSLIDTVDAFYDLANVEVLRGPQGTLVGSNSDGGAIFVNSVQPTFDKVKGYVEQTLGNYQDRRTEGAVNLPLSDMFAARIAFVYETRNSFTTNLGPEPPPGIIPSAQNQPGNVDFEAVRLQLTFKPNDDFQATLRFEPYQSRNDNYALKPDMAAISPTSTSYDPYAASIQNRPFVIDYDAQQYQNITGERIGLTGVWHVTDAVELKSVTNYQDGTMSDLTDMDEGTAPSNIYLVRKASFNTFTQELNVLSTAAGAFQWVAGAYYLSTVQPLALSFVNFPQPPFSVSAQHQNEAVFASGTYQFSPQWSVTLGGRYSHDSLPYTEISPPIGKTPLTESKPTGTLKVNFQVTPETLTYVSVATGYKAGGNNLQVPPFFTPPPVPAETNVVEEVGLKTTLFDNHLRFDGDVFNSKYSHYQLQEANPQGLPLTQGPGDADIYGMEAEFTGAFNALQFNLGTSYMHGTVSSDFTYTLPTGTPVTIGKGTEIPFAPKWLANAGVQYTIPTAGGTVTPRAQVHYQASQFTNIENQISFENANLADVLPARTTADFRLTYAAPQNWDLEAYVLNFTNRTYITEINPSPIGVTAPGLLYGAPRQFGGRFTYRF